MPWFIRTVFNLCKNIAINSAKHLECNRKKV